LKLDELMALTEEIDVNRNQIVVWASRRNLLDLCAARFEKEGYTFARYDGSASGAEKETAEQAFIKREAAIFLANQSSEAYGLNRLARCECGGVESDGAGNPRDGIGESRVKKRVQITGYMPISEHAEERYPNLYKEIREHDRVSNSSWYSLSPEAFSEWKKFKRTIWYEGR
jgi:hypothetical protein